jgi:light-regulated signal transduction histidine kinase (bacteriophytochrome)
MTKLQLYRTKRQIYLWLIRDMTSLKNAEIELNQKKEELEDFVYSVSHDLKSPIVSVQGYSALLKEDLYKNFDDTHKHYFDRVINNINLMQKMIQDLLELSRIGKLEKNITTESSNDIIKDALDEFYYQIEKRKIKIVLPKRFPRIKCNRKSLTLVFTNLISNAIKFMGNQKKPVIELGFIRKSEKNIFFVKDNGIGLDVKEADKIFNVFYRSQELKDVEGTGIGLTVAKKVIKYHNGKIWVDSKPTKGSTFYFSLPKIISKNNGHW